MLAPFRPLNQEFAPVIFEAEVPLKAMALLGRLDSDLTGLAEIGGNNCWGHYYEDSGPVPPETATVFDEFAEAWPRLEHGGRTYDLAWVRRSTGGTEQAGSTHLDASPVTGIRGGGEAGVIPARKIWRAVVNLSDLFERKIEYLDADVRDIPWQADRGFVRLADGADNSIYPAKTLVLPHRNGARAWAANLCVSRVAHSGRDDNQGHFLASFVHTEPAL
jgi:hypothetical protein